MFERLWCLHDAEPRGGALNMAIDELILEHAAATARPVLRTYRWAEPFVSIGYFDRIDIIEEQFPNRPLVRRWTGGGAVDHREDFAFTLAVPGADPSAGWPAARRYLAIHGCVSAALAQLGVAAESVGRARSALKLPAPAPCFAAPVCGDLMADGRKIVGGAQRRTRNGVLHQGSIQNLPARIDWPALAPALATAFGRACEETTLDAEWLRRAGALADARYGNNEWLRAR
jgi:lipoyl(octanoyl) transferase